MKSALTSPWDEMGISRRKVKTMPIRLRWVAMFTVLSGLFILSWPYAVSTYHMERAGRALASTPPDLQRTILSARQAITLMPNRADAHRLLGQAYLAQGDLVAAAESLTRFTQLQPDNPEGWWQLGLVYERMVEQLEGTVYEESIDRLEEAMVTAWRSGGFTAQAFIYLGKHAHHAKQPWEAMKWYERAVRIAPDLGDPWYYIGLEYQGLERWEEALASFQYALSRPAMGIGRSSVYHQVGWLQARKIDPPDLSAALAAFDAAIAQDDFVGEEQVIQAHYQRADVLRLLGLGEEALLEYEWVIARRPEHYWAHVYLGRLYWQVQRDQERAERTLLRAIALQPDTKWAYRQLGIIYQQAGRADQAAAMYRQVLALDPSDERAKAGLDELSLTRE